MEYFFHTLKVELVQQRRWATREQGRRNLFAYLESYYNRRRIHSARTQDLGPGGTINDLNPYPRKRRNIRHHANLSKRL